jgi:hypothetical protein
LLVELNHLGSADEAAIWAHNRLRDKNDLTAADAEQVEAAFRSKLRIFPGVSADEQSATALESDKPGRSSALPLGKSTKRSSAKAIDKSVLAVPEPRRIRDRDHVRSVAKKPCLICGRQPSDPHHLRFVQSRSLGRKVSDEFTVPLCRGHHRELHRCGDESGWWSNAGIDPTVTARTLWLETHPLPTASFSEESGYPPA